jgi:hypothetical protein
MKNLLRNTRTAVRRPRTTLSVTALETRNLLTTGLPPVNLSAATIQSLGQQLASFASHVDGSNAVKDLNAAAAEIQSDINEVLAHPHVGPGQLAKLQLDVDALAVVDQAIFDLAPPPPPPPVFIAA